MVKGLAVLRAARAIGGTVAIILTISVTLRARQLTMTLDLFLKLLITFVYSHRLSGFSFRFPWSKGTGSQDTKDQLSLLESGLLLDEKKDVLLQIDSMTISDDSPRVLATVVGWREEETLYRTCLQSLAASPQCHPIIAGIDGDTEVDDIMVNTFLNVFPNGSVIRLQEPLSRELDRFMLSANLTDINDTQTCELVMKHLSNVIRTAINEQLPQGVQSIQELCIVQPHQSKKDILFTTLCFARLISEDLGIEYVFSTDSDSDIMPGAIGKMARLFENDTNIGGVAGHVRFTHPRPTWMSHIAVSFMWFDQEITKAQGAIFGATDCQPGPCAAFRVSALNSVLVPWYCQTVLGQRTVINEDRHLTTRLLYAGYAVHYAPDALVYTDTPSTFETWVKQQVRWSRSLMIETLWYPAMIDRISPWLIYNILKSRVMPIAAFWIITSYALGFGGVMRFNTISAMDILCMLAIRIAYLTSISADKPTASDILWLVPSQAWFILMMPGIVIWSLITLLDTSWGTNPRGLQGSKEKGSWPKIDSALKGVIFLYAWLGVVSVAVVRILVASVPR